MAHLYFSAAHKSSGKTTLTIAIARAFRDRGLVVAPFKKGPDYIDPLWLSQAAGSGCFNLDFNTMTRAAIRAAFARESAGADLALIEGNVGLFDSTDMRGWGSNAELAKLLGSGVVLVLDCQGMARGVAPLLLGYQSFDPALSIDGVVLNKVAGERHRRSLVSAVEHYTDIPVIGAVQRDDSLRIAERHLGLMPSNESDESEDWIRHISARVTDQLDLDRLSTIAARAPQPVAVGRPVPVARSAVGLRIGIAQDAAFGFYYPEDLRDLTAAGAELVPFSPVGDRALPEVDGLFIGGGFPEYRMAELEANHSMRASIAAFSAAGGPIYAECGGLMYLCRAVRWGEQRNEMVGALNAEVEMRSRPQGRGYVRLRETAAFPWPDGDGGREIRAHEFHHSAVVEPDPSWTYAFDVLRGSGIDGGHDGVVQGNLLACYSHLRGQNTAWTSRFLAHVGRCRGRP